MPNHLGLGIGKKMERVAPFVAEIFRNFLSINANGDRTKVRFRTVVSAIAIQCSTERKCGNRCLLCLRPVTQW